MKELTRRGFVVAASLAAVGGTVRTAAGHERSRPRDRSPVFRHGVASGDPLHDRAILWTRVTPKRVHDDVLVRWQVARDPRMKKRVCGGSAWTDASRDFTVKIDARDLEPDRTYYYRFETSGARSPIGRTRTLPLFAARRLRFAVASCANYPYGYFNVYRRIAERADLDFVVHLGDYIYEYANGQYGDGTATGRIPAPDREMVSLGDYRLRHATYKTDPDLQEAHRQHPFIAVWDDHESTNDSWQGGAQNHNPEAGEGDWEDRKRASIRAYFEWMPIREPQRRSSGVIHRSFRVGNLAEIDMLDTRLYGRDQQASGPGDTATLIDPTRQLLGVEQETWLFNRLYHSHAQGVRWRVLGQQVMMAQLSADRGASPINVDQWDGYAPARARLFEHLIDHDIRNTVVLTGDIHSSWGNDLTTNPYDSTVYDPITGRGSRGVELVTPAVTSPGIEPPAEAAQTAALLRAVNPHMKYVELNKRGYVVVDIDRDRVHSEWYHVETIADRDNTQTLAAALRSESMSDHLVPAQQFAPLGEAAELAPDSETG